MAEKNWSSTAPPGEFRPYIPASQDPAEFSLRAVVLGALFGVLFGAVSVYVGLRAGFTVSASIPIAVLSISILRAFGRATILENNIVQTTGSAGESVAAGVIFSHTRTNLSGIFAERRILADFFPVADGRLAGRTIHDPAAAPTDRERTRELELSRRNGLRGRAGCGRTRRLVCRARFLGAGTGRRLHLHDEHHGHVDGPARLSAGVATRRVVPRGGDVGIFGCGVHHRTQSGGILFAGGVFSWLVLNPAIKFFGSLSPTVPLYPSTVPIALMTPDQLWSSYIRPMGAGAVAAAGLITLIKTLPTIISALRAGLKDVRARNTNLSETSRTERDLSMRVVLVGAVVIVAMMWGLLTFKPIPGAQTGFISNVIAAVFVVVFGFLFVTVASRISGLIGNSSNPISGMTIATLMATCAMFLVMGWTANAYAVLALTIGGVVCIASAIAGATSQDLKTGYLVGATPVWQQSDW